MAPNSIEACLSTAISSRCCVSVEQLRARGVKVRYDIYPGEGHLFTKRENQANAPRDAADFLLAHLAPSEPVTASAATAHASRR